MAAETPQHDLEAERAVLASALLNGSTIATLEALVSPEDFYHPAHAEVWSCILAVSGRSEPVDVLTVAAELRGRDRLNTVGGGQFLGSLTDWLPTTAHHEAHARIVSEDARVRRMVQAARDVLAKASGGRVAADDLEDLGAARFEAAAAKRQTGEVCAVGQVVSDAMERLFQGKAKPRGLPTALHRLTELTGGMRPGQLWILAARPGLGKSSLAAQFAVAAAQFGPVLFCSLEMGREEIGDRLLCTEARVDAQKFRDLRLTPADLEALNDASHRLVSLPIEIVDTGDQRLADVRAAARKLHRRHGSLALIVVDYIQLMKASRDRDNREREVAEISRGLKLLAKDLGTTVLALSQLNRDGEKGTTPRRPRLSDLRESGSIEQDADKVLFIHRERDPEDAEAAPEVDDVLLIVEKQRSDGSRKAVLPLKFRGACTRFDDVAADLMVPAEPACTEVPDGDDW